MTLYDNYVYDCDVVHLMENDMHSLSLSLSLPPPLQGKDGADGEKGRSGPGGEQGVPGPAGPQGRKGPDGKPVSSGHSVQISVIRQLH